MDAHMNTDISLPVSFPSLPNPHISGSFIMRQLNSYRPWMQFPKKPGLPLGTYCQPDILQIFYLQAILAMVPDSTNLGPHHYEPWGISVPQ